MALWHRLSALCALMIICGALHSLGAQDRIRIVAAERGFAFSGGNLRLPDDNHVMLVLTVRGFTEDQWNQLPLSRFVVSDGTNTYHCQLRTAASLREVSSVVGEPRLVFMVPKAAMTLSLRFRSEPPIPFVSSSKIQNVIQ